jgi:type I restriction enzyme M protein
MSKMLTQARTMCPELKEAVKELDSLAYQRQYDTVFRDLIDWMIWEHQYPPTDEHPLKARKYNEEEIKRFLNIYKNIQEEIRNRTMLWADETDNNKTFYDGLGRMYELITSGYKSSMLGQYFTPEPVVEFMTSILDIGSRDKFERVLDPACGSGRMGLCAASHAHKKGTMVWVTMNDIDPICTKVTAVNMALHGVVGEALCMNGLDIEGDSYKFGYQVVPLLSFIPQESWEMYRAIMLAKTRQDIRKQYVLRPVEYKDTFMKSANDKILEDWKERQKIENKAERANALEELERQVNDRLKGSLFENDSSQVENIKLPSEEKPKSKKNKKPSKPSSNNQQLLFD